MSILPRYNGIIVSALMLCAKVRSIPFRLCWIDRKEDWGDVTDAHEVDAKHLDTMVCCVEILQSDMFQLQRQRVTERVDVPI